MSDEQAEILLDHIDLAREAHTDMSETGPQVFSIIVTGLDALRTKFWCAVHISSTDMNLVICEFEFQDDQIFPLQPTADASPASPEDTLDATPSEMDIVESTTSL